MIAILGSGISGLFAAWACLINGKNFVIYTNDGKKPYVMPCTYLHQDCGIPFLSRVSLKQYVIPKRLDDIDISHDYMKLGKMYSKKVYGEEDAKNNFAEKGLRTSHAIWNMQQAVDFLWNAVEDNITPLEIKGLLDIKGLSEKHNLVISTLPLDSVDKDNVYGYKIRWITEFESSSSEDYCIFNVSDNTDWYRMGNVFGRSFIESLNQLETDSYAVKKLSSVDNLPSINKNVLFAGRYGSWNQKILAHDVFFATLRAI